MTKEKKLIQQIKYVIDHNVSVLGDIVGDDMRNLYANGVLEGYKQMQGTIRRLEEASSDNNKA